MSKLLPTNHFWKKSRKRKINPHRFMKNARLKWYEKTDQIFAIYKYYYAPVSVTTQGYVLITIYDSRIDKKKAFTREFMKNSLLN